MALSERCSFLLLTLVVAMAVVVGSAAAENSERRSFESVAMPSSGKGNANGTLSLYSLLSICELIPFTPPSIFNISSIDPRTGAAIANVYSTGQTCQLLAPVAPLGDPRTKSAYIPAYHRNSWFDVWGEPALNIFDMSNPNKIASTRRIPLPILSDWIAIFTYSNVVLDPVTNSVWLVANTLDVGNKPLDITFVVKVDLNKGVAYNITAITLPNLAPMVDSENHGGTLNVKSRKFIFPLQAQDKGVTNNMIAEFDVDQNKFTSISNTNYTINRMVWDSSSGNTYGFLQDRVSFGRVSYGVLEPGTGVWRIIKQYPSNYIGAGVMVIDSSAGVIYGTFDASPDLTYVTVSVRTGEILTAHPLTQKSTTWSGLFGV